MPKLLANNIVVVNQDELVPNFFSCYQSLNRRLRNDEQKGYGIEVYQRGGGKDNRLLINYDSLPKRYQQKLPDPRKPEHILQRYYKTDMSAVKYYNSYQYPDGSYLLPETIEELINNASVLTALIHLENARISERLTKGGSKRGIIGTLYTDVHSFNAWLLKTHNFQHTLNSSLKRFKQQLNAFKTDSYYGIIKDPEGKSKRNALKRDEKTNQLLRNLFAGQDHKPSATEVANQYEAFLAGYLDVINKETGELYDPKTYKSISSRTITSFLTTWDSKIGTDAKRVGNDRQPLVSQYIPYHSFEMPTLAGSLISIDDRQPPFHYNQNKDRMWWYIGIDLASEAIVAWAYGKSKKELILNFYRNMVTNHNKWNCKLPAEVECESSLNSSFTNTFLKDGAMFEYVTMYKNLARSKRIERFFRELRYDPEFEKSRLGWLARPFAKDETNKQGPKNNIIVPYHTLVKQCFQDIIKWNNMPKKGSKISRYDYYVQNQNPELVETNYKSFIKDLGTTRKTSCNAGIVKFNSTEWLIGDKGEIYTGEKLTTLLKKVETKDISVSFLDDGQGEIIKAFVYDINDHRYICELQPKPKYQKAKKEKTDADRAAAILMSAYTNTVAIYQRTQKNSIENVEIINNKPSIISDTFKIPGLDLENLDHDEFPEQTIIETSPEEAFEYLENINPNKNHLDDL